MSRFWKKWQRRFADGGGHRSGARPAVQLPQPGYLHGEWAPADGPLADGQGHPQGLPRVRVPSGGLRDSTSDRRTSITESLTRTALLAENNKRAPDPVSGRLCRARR